MGPLVVYAVALPLLHLFLYRFGSPEQAFAAFRELSVLLFTPILAAMAFAYQETLRVENRRLAEQHSRAQARLAQVHKLAAMGQLGAGIAHQLTRPLATILTLAETLRGKPRGQVGEVSEELKLICEQTLRMAEIVDNVRGFARESRLELRTTRALEPVDKALMLVSERLRLANIEVLRSPEEGLPSIWGDSLRLQEIFLSLLTNSLQAFEDVPDVRKQVVLGARASGGFVEYTVEDNGPGVPERLVSTLFDPFRATGEVAGGMGLGLPLASVIAKEHRGDLRYESRPGGGARFILQIPISADA